VVTISDDVVWVMVARAGRRKASPACQAATGQHAEEQRQRPCRPSQCFHRKERVAKEDDTGECGEKDDQLATTGGGQCHVEGIVLVNAATLLPCVETAPRAR
jgi:hypothetical protein